MQITTSITRHCHTAVVLSNYRSHRLLCPLAQELLSSVATFIRPRIPTYRSAVFINRSRSLEISIVHAHRSNLFLSKCQQTIIATSKVSLKLFSLETNKEAGEFREQTEFLTPRWQNFLIRKPFANNSHIFSVIRLRPTPRNIVPRIFSLKCRQIRI